MQGAVGNWAGAFWVADSSSDACALQSPARVDLIDASGQVRLSATTPFIAIPLSAGARFPAADAPPAGHLAFVTLFWPTDPNAALAMGATSGACPIPDFVPRSARFAFGDSGPITVTTLRADDGEIAICGNHISLDIGPLSP